MENKEVPIQENAIDQPVKSENKASFLKKNKKALIIIGAIAFILVILAYGSPYVYFMRSTPNTNTSTSSTISLPQATIGFLPGTNIGAGVGQTQSVDIIIDTQGREVSSGVISLLYDPKAVGNVRLTQVKDPTSALSSSFEKGEVYNDKKGSLVSLSLHIPDTIPMQKGKGKVATLSFVRLNTKPTMIVFGPNTGFLTRNSNAAITFTKSALSLQTLPSSSSK